MGGWGGGGVGWVLLRFRYHLDFTESCGFSISHLPPLFLLHGTMMVIKMFLEVPIAQPRMKTSV